MCSCRNCHNPVRGRLVETADAGAIVGEMAMIEMPLEPDGDCEDGSQVSAHREQTVQFSHSTDTELCTAYHARYRRSLAQNRCDLVTE